jgi:hypothetical protein
MIFKSLELKVNLESLLSAYVAIRFLVFLGILTLFPQLRKLIYYCTRKDFKYHFFHE